MSLEDESSERRHSRFGLLSGEKKKKSWNLEKKNEKKKKTKTRRRRIVFFQIRRDEEKVIRQWELNRYAAFPKTGKTHWGEKIRRAKEKKGKSDEEFDFVSFYPTVFFPSFLFFYYY